MALITAVLFDLDGTLLHLDVDEFMKPYVHRLSEAMAHLIPPERFGDVLMTAVTAMIQDEDPTATNEVVFWRKMYQLTGVEKSAAAPYVDAFYRDTFPALSSVGRRTSAAARVVAQVAQQGYRLVLATNPIFPKVAIKERLRWAGLDPESFTLITSYENMSACKPNPSYYEQICHMLGMKPQNAVMVGNDPLMDIEPAAALGMATYWVDDVTLPGKAEAEFAATRGSMASRDPFVTVQGNRHLRGPLRGVPSFVAELL